MNRYLIICLISLITFSVSSQTLKDIRLFTDYSSAGSKRLMVTKAHGLGVGADIRFELFKGLHISLVGGYQLLHVNQDSVIQQLKWDYWDYRYKGNIAVDLLDTTVNARITPFEKMDVLPFKINISYNHELLKDLFVTPSIGGGMIFYTRRIYIEESWSKYYANADYTFNYTYRNFAPKMEGNPIFLTGGLDFDYVFSDIVSLYAGFNYNYILNTAGKLGYDNLPFENYYSIKLGLTFLY